MLEQDLPYEMQRLKHRLAEAARPASSATETLAGRVGELTAELKRRRVQETPLEQRAAGEGHVQRGEAISTGPLASVAAWESAAGPRISGEQLRTRLEQYRVAEAFQEAAEADFGGDIAIDLQAFAKGEI